MINWQTHCFILFGFRKGHVHGTSTALKWGKRKKKWCRWFYPHWSTDSVFHVCKIFLKPLVLKLHLCEGKGWPVSSKSLYFFFCLFMLTGIHRSIRKRRKNSCSSVQEQKMWIFMWWLGKAGYELDSFRRVGRAGQTEGCSDRWKVAVSKTVKYTGAQLSTVLNCRMNCAVMCSALYSVWLNIWISL